jgi:hypothetical protein
MSDEPLPPGSINVEDDGPAPPPPAVDPPAEPVAPPEPVAATPEDLQQANGDPKTAGLLAALRAEREKSAALKDRAARAEEYEQTIRQQAPYVQFLQANPGLMQPKAPEPPPAPPQADPEAVEAAQLYDFYKPDGTLDIDRGKKHVEFVRRNAGHVTQEAVRPFQQMTRAQQSEANFQRALQTTAPNGQKPSEAALRSVWTQLGPESTADQQVAAVAWMTALGAEAMTQRKPVAPPALAPVVTEPSGGRTTTPAALTPLEMKIAANRGVKPEQWAAHTSAFQPGREQVLED